MITQFNCNCGTTNISDAHYYDGAIGYEAIVCKRCGRYSDHMGTYDADEWSRQFIQTKEHYAKKHLVN